MLPVTWEQILLTWIKAMAALFYSSLGHTSRAPWFRTSLNRVITVCRCILCDPSWDLRVLRGKDL